MLLILIPSEHMMFYLHICMAETSLIRGSLSAAQRASFCHSALCVKKGVCGEVPLKQFPFLITAKLCSERIIGAVGERLHANSLPS